MNFIPNNSNYKFSIKCFSRYLVLMILFFSANSKADSIDYSLINFGTEFDKNQVLNASTHKLLTKTTSDLNRTAQIEGKETVKISIGSQIKKGINFYNVNDLNISQKIKDEVNQQRTSFYIDATNERIIIGCSSHPHSYSYAFYSLQQLLGIYYLMYSDEGNIMPNSKIILDIPGKVYKQKIPNTLYGETYGVYGKGHLIHLKQRFQKRNNFLDESVITSHGITKFYRQNINEILKSRIEDKNNPIMWDHRFLNLNNPRTIELLKEFALSEADKNGLKGVSLSPADGIGGGEKDKITLDIKAKNAKGKWYLLEKDKVCQLTPKPSVTNGVQLKNLHEVNWWVANMLTEYIYEQRPTYEGLTSMNAYGDGDINVQPPVQSKVNDKLFVQLIPYAFQTYYNPPKKMFEDWENKAELKGIYDYLAITQYNKNGLGINTIDQLFSREDEWFNNQYSFNRLKFETTGFSLNIIHFLWISQQLNNSWNTKSAEELFDKWSLMMFGDAKVDMVEFLKTNTSKTNMPFAIKSLEKAYIKNPSDRIWLYILYAFYHKLYYGDSYEDLLNYSFYHQDKGLFQNYSIYNRGELINKKWKKPKLSIDYYLKNAKYKNLEPLQILGILKNKFQQVYQFSSFHFDSKKLYPSENTKAYTYIPYAVSIDKFSFTPTSNKNFAIVLTPKEKGASVHVTDNEDYNQFFEFDDKDLGKEKTIILENLTIGKTYNFVPNKKFTTVTLPKEIPFLVNSFRKPNARYPWHYIYIPKDLSEIWISGEDDMNSKYSNSLFEIDAIGERTKNMLSPKKITKNGVNYFKVEIPARYRGKVMQIYLRYDNIRILNYNAPLSFQHFKYIEN